MDTEKNWTWWQIVETYWFTWLVQCALVGVLVVIGFFLLGGEWRA